MDSPTPEGTPPERSDQSCSAFAQQPTISIENLVDLISHELEGRASQNGHEEAKQPHLGLVSKAQDEEIENGKPSLVHDWKKIDPMVREEIFADEEAHEEAYSAFWKDHESTPTERETTEKAYRLAFENFPFICHTLGWYKTDDLVFHAYNLQAYRQILMEALFAVEPYELAKLSRSMGQSQAAFEYSRLPRLMSILVRLENRRNMGFECTNGVCSDYRLFNAAEILDVLVEIGRTLRSSGPRNMSQIGMQGLLDRCYARRILSQPDADDIKQIEYQIHLIYDCFDALEFTARFDEVRSAPLCLTFYLKYRCEPVEKIFHMVKSHKESINGLKTFKELPLKESSSPTFNSSEFTVQNLQDFGELNIEWTDCLDDHLTIFAGRNALRIFAHPTFLYNCQDLQQRDYFDPNYSELSQTYALLFKPTSALGLMKLDSVARCENFSFLGDGIEMQKPLINRPGLTKRRWGDRDYDINPTLSPAKYILENFYRCSLPPTIQAAFNISNPHKNIMDTGSFDQNKVSTTSMREINSLYPFYPEDIRFMMASVFQHQFNRTEAFLRFEYFGPRLRRLKTYLDDRQPQNLWQLWFDRRNAGDWWRMWGSAFFFTAFFALSVAQVVLAVKLSRKQF